MTIIINYVQAMDENNFTKKRLEVQPPVNLKAILFCDSAIVPYQAVKEDLVPCILETGDEIDNNHPWVQAWEPAASLRWGFNVVWLPRGKEIPKKGTVAEKWKLDWRFLNSEIAIRCMLMELHLEPWAARCISRIIVEFLPAGDAAMPLSTKRAKLIYQAFASSEVKNRKTGHITNEWSAGEIYKILREEIQERKIDPEPSLIGIQSVKLPSKHGPLIWAAEMEINKIFNKIYYYLPQDVNNVPNPHFSINFTHQGKRDSFPLYSWYDSDITALCSLIVIAAEAIGMPITQDNIGRFNVIVRQYREGDNIGWHTDWAGYSDRIGGLIIVNKDPSRGLCFYRNGRYPLMLHEEPGLVFRVSGEARKKWKHGFSARENMGSYPPQRLRTSVTFRFFSKTRGKLKRNSSKKRNFIVPQTIINNLPSQKLQMGDSWNNQWNGHIWKMSDGLWGKSSPFYWQGETCVEENKGELHRRGIVKHSRPARPTDINSYNLMKTLGLNVVKPGTPHLTFDNHKALF